MQSFLIFLTSSFLVEAPSGLVMKHHSLRNVCFVCKLYVGSLHSQGENGGNMCGVDGGMVTILASRYLKQGRHLVRESNQKRSWKSALV